MSQNVKQRLSRTPKQQLTAQLLVIPLIRGLHAKRKEAAHFLHTNPLCLESDMNDIILHVCI